MEHGSHSCLGRSGHSELWVSNRDGSQARQADELRGRRARGKPLLERRRHVDRVRRDRAPAAAGVSTSSPLTAAPRKPLISDDFNNIRPSWSIDGQWIYFASNRTGDWQIWKMPSAGGTPEQITRAAAGTRSFRRMADTSTTRSPRPSRVSGKSRSREATKSRSSSGAGRWVSTSQTRESSSWMPPRSRRRRSRCSASPRRQLVPVARLPAGLRLAASRYFTVTRDGRSMLYTRSIQWTSDIEMLREFVGIGDLALGQCAPSLAPDDVPSTSPRAFMTPLCSAVGTHDELRRIARRHMAGERVGGRTRPRHVT